MKLLRGTIGLVRPSSSLLLFAMLFIPLAWRSGNLIASLKLALPMLLIGFCTFIANDLDDIDADKVNHPERALPSQDVSPFVAATLYFICLAAALLATRTFVPPHTAFFYYLTITLTISYRYVITFMPAFKAPYAAATIAVPVIIVAHHTGREQRQYIVAVAVFAFALGRELCMDVADRAGDKKSIMHHVNPESMGVYAFLLQAISLLFVALTRLKFDSWTFVAFGAIVLLMLIAGIFWFGLRRHGVATEIMKVQLLVGLYFLV